MGFLSASKDRLVESMAMAMLNRSRLQAYGRITGLKLNSEEKKIEAALELKGEREPVHISLHQYELLQEAGKLFIIPRRLSASREWITALAGDFLVGRKFELPAEAASVISQCL